MDLYELRRAVAALVHARHHIDDLTDVEIVRVDDAMRWLRHRRGELDGDLAAAAARLLSDGRDADGQCTVAAIDRLAALVRVDRDSAEAISALPEAAHLYRDGGGALRLFDPDTT